MYYLLEYLGTYLLVLPLNERLAGSALFLGCCLFMRENGECRWPSLLYQLFNEGVLLHYEDSLLEARLKKLPWSAPEGTTQ